MRMNAFIFRRKNYEMNYLDKIMIIFMSRILNMNFFLN